MPKRPLSPNTSLHLGVSKHEINPPPGLRLMGYPVERPNIGVESDLHIRTAVFCASSHSPAAALVVLDNLYAPAPIVAAIRRAATKRLPALKPNSIMVAATHTHSAPALHPYYSASESEGLLHPDRSYCRKVIDAAVATLVAAWENRLRVVARLGKGQAALGHNRRVVIHSNAHNEWEDPRRRHTGYFNPDIPFVLFEDAETGATHAIVTGYGCHPVTLGPGNRMASADFPGYFAAQLEKQTGAQIVIHTSSGAGDINPLRCLRDGPHQARHMGRSLAEAVLQAIPHATPIRLGKVSSRTTGLRFRVRDNAGRWAHAQMRGRISRGCIQTEVQTIDLGELTLINAPGELFSEIATRVRSASPTKATFVVEHANDALGYIFTDKAATEGGYEVCRASLSESMERPYLAAATKSLKTKSRRDTNER